MFRFQFQLAPLQLGISCHENEDRRFDCVALGDGVCFRVAGDQPSAFAAAEGRGRQRVGTAG